MSIELYEKIDSQGFKVDRKNGSAIPLRYILKVSGDSPDTAAAVNEALRFNIPLKYEGYDLLNYGANPIGPGLWDGEANYGPLDGSAADPDNPSENPSPPDQDSPLGSEWEFDTTGATYKITQSLSTLIKAGPAGDGLDYTDPADNGTNDPNAPDYGKAIGVTKDGVEGVEIPIRGPIHVVTTRIIPARAITMRYIDTLVRLTNRTNDTPWWGRKTGEWQFLGARGKTRDKSTWSVTYLFDAGTIQKDISIGGYTVAVKAPFDYLWTEYRRTESANRVVMIPRFSYVERVVGSGSFSSLGIT